MIELVVEEIKDYGEYILRNLENAQRISLILEFYNMQKPIKGDRLILSKKLLDKTSLSYVQPYAFAFEGFREDMKDLDDRFAMLKTKNKILLLKRLYG